MFRSILSHPVEGFPPTPKGRAMMSPRRSSGASRLRACAPSERRDQRGRLGSPALGASRFGSATNRRAAGRLRSGDPFPLLSHPLVTCSTKRHQPSRGDSPTFTTERPLPSSPVLLWQSLLFSRVGVCGVRGSGSSVVRNAFEADYRGVRWAIWR